jgi:nitrile hydratase
MSEDIHQDHPALRIEALESLLIERGVLVPGAVDRVIEYFETSVGPMHGARVVARAWKDPAYRERLLRDGTRAVAELGIGGVAATDIVVVANTPSLHNVVVCTLCSCYPWSVLGLPPAWYKSPEYRSRVVREPRSVLAELGLTLPDDVAIRVWDSSAEVRYMVLPEQPPGTEGLTEDELAKRVTRESMIGVGVPR